MKIVMCTDAYWPRVNGVTVSVDSFARALIRNGHQVVIICSFYPDTMAIERMSNPLMDRRETEADPIVIRVPSYSLPISREDRVAKFHKWFWVEKQLSAFNPDLIHVNSEFVIGEFGYYYARMHDLPVVYTFHTMWEDYAANYIPYVPEFILRMIARSIVKRLCRKATTVICPTSQIADLVRRYKTQAPVHLLPTGIDPRLFTPQPDGLEEFRQSMIARFPALTRSKILLFAGRIGKEKNISFLLELFPTILHAAPDTTLLLVGNGPDLPHFLDQANELGITDHVVFTGYLDRKDLAYVYAMSTVFVFPSRTETQGLVTIEAMLSGIPVVAVGEMGTVTVMGGDNGGFMVKNDPAEFAGRVIELLLDDELYAQKVEDARIHAQSWTIDSMTARLEDIYTTTLEDFNA